VSHLFETALTLLTKMRFHRTFSLFALVVMTGFASQLAAQQQFRGTCAQVKIEILQTLTTERIGFEATLKITNNQSEEALTDFSARLTFENPELSTDIDTHDASDFFFVRLPNLDGINAIDGSGVISPTKTAIVRWFIIPKPDAGGVNPSGIFYNVGVELGGSMGGLPVPQEQYIVIPDTIQVKPEPRLDITYFQPRDVQGDDPFTAEVESPIPFTLGVIVKNTGFAPAKNVAIDSEQPKIVENQSGLLLVAQLLGARVEDSELDDTSLTVNLGDIPPGEARKGAWDMITSLSGEFIEFKASYTHSAELGGEETSLIESLEAHFIAAEVRNDEPGRDDILDFLADTDRDENMYPDALYENNGNILPVNLIVDHEIGEPQGREVELTLRPGVEGWNYARLDDPGQAKYGIEEVIRSDGKLLDLNNVWTNVRYDPITNEKLTYLNILDRVEIGEYDYILTYAPIPADSDAPITELRFAGEVTREGDNYFITRDTQMYFTSEDINAVSIFYKVNNGEFRPGIPFTFDDPGTYEVIYYGSDAAGNDEVESFARLIIGNGGPGFDAVDTPEQALFLSGDVLSARTDAARINFTPSASGTQVDANIKIFEGVKAFPRLMGLPLSPNPLTEITIGVAGDYTDFYRYRLNAANWSSEQAVSETINLSGLSGSVTLEIVARSQYGAYPEFTDALIYEWEVDADAADVQIGGLSSWPTRSSDLTLSLGGGVMTEYRWTIDDDFYRAPLNADDPFELEALEAGTRKLSFNTDADGALTSDEELIFNLEVAPSYGSGFDGFDQILNLELMDIAGVDQTFVWDGRNGADTLQRPGWYTVLISLENPLGQVDFVSQLVKIEELTTTPDVVASIGDGANALHARGRLAVWQQRDGIDWDIYLKDYTDPGALPEVLTMDAISQTAPHTDGRWVVWQQRQPNSSSDIFAYDSENPGVGFVAVTNALDQVQSNPVIAWPWVVYQQRPLADATAPEQLFAYNLESGERFAIDPSTQDQLDATIHAGRVAWRDLRDVGNGEIYFADLESTDRRRLSTDVFGQFFPSIRGNWVVWQDNRHGQLEIYGYNLLKNSEIRITDTTFDEAHPYLLDQFVLYEEDSLDPELANLRILDLETGLSVPLTRGDRLNEFPVEAGGYLIWQRRASLLSEQREVLSVPLPALQLIADNANAVPITATIADRYSDVYSLLEVWGDAAAVSQISRFTAYEPNLVEETAEWDGSAASGTNFPLTVGSFIWVRFNDSVALDLGPASGSDIDLVEGLNVVSHTDFPSEFNAYDLIESIGASKVEAVRILDARAGLWNSVSVDGTGQIIGHNFRIPKTSVVLLELSEAVASWNPQRN